MSRHVIRTMVRGAYDIQKLRIQIGNRIVANFKVKLGIAPGIAEDTLDKEGQEVLKDVRMRYTKITDAAVAPIKPIKFVGDDIISTYTEYCLITQYLEIERDETNHFKRLGSVLKEHPIYTEFLEGVRGCGPAMSGVIISEIDIAVAEYPSSLWRYAGLDVGPDGRGRSKRKEHLIDVAYTDREGEEHTKKSITYNPFLKTKLMGVLAPSFLRSKSPYREVYDNYKHRLDNMPAHADKTKLHKHNMALRYMTKRFLVDLYREWRTLEGLPVAPEYSEAKLGIIHRKAG